jgi:cysteine protease ATG4
MYHILGKTYESPIHQDLHYACYRNDFPPFEGFTDDVGWGCTLRSFQMVVSNTLARVNIQKPQQFIRDDPAISPFALQRMVSIGKTKYKVEPGEWYSPSVAAKILLDCIASNYLETYPECPIDIVIHNGSNKPDFSRSVLLLFPVRLGIDKLEKSYQNTLLQILQHPCSMGLVSGKKTSAYYIIGFAPDGKLLYMDPHDLRSHHDENYTCGRLYSNLVFDKLNPSMAIAFLLTNNEQYENVVTTFSNIFDTCETTCTHLNEQKCSCNGNTATYICLEDDDDFCLVQEEDE